LGLDSSSFLSTELPLQAGADDRLERQVVPARVLLNAHSLLEFGVGQQIHRARSGTDPERLKWVVVQPENPSDLIRRWALEAGFDRVGIATLAPSSNSQSFHRWLERGDHAGMTYMSRRSELRVDPGKLFPTARSAVCVALQYSPLLDERTAAGDLWPRVARYARGVDYHDLMRSRLETLAGRVREVFPDCVTRPYVDTGPVLERELATRAGLGSFGKNTMLLNEESGSWLLLGELFLSLDLEPDVALADLCGSCTRCLEACPTGALPEAYRLDANRCISYWTIEHRGVVPVEIRSQLSGWVFGCDLCQDACPWSGGAVLVDHPELRLPAQRAELDLSALLRIDREQYVERFRGSPMKRSKQEGLQRNAALAMGGSGDPRYVPVLLEALEEEVSQLVRIHVAWALGKIGGEDARAGLEARRSIEPDPAVVREIDLSLHEFESPGE
jgi:epoxyqueuosine reductase